MALPKQVQRDMEDVAAYDASMAELTAGTEAVEQTAHPVLAAVPIAGVSEPVSAVAEVLVPAVDAESAKEEAAWQQKYRTLRGMFDAEVPVLHRQNKELTAAIQKLHDEIAVLKAGPAPSTPTTSLVSDDEVLEFGADFIDVQRRITKEEMSPILAQLEAIKHENTALREQVGQTGSQVATMSFEQKLLLAAPDFDTINADPRWVEWLDDIDPMLRAPRRGVAQAAYERGDIEATVSYIDMFRRLTNPVDQHTSAAASELRSQVAPSRSASSAGNPVATQERIYTESEVSSLFDKVGALYRQGKNEEASKLDTELTLAFNTGRVR